MVSAPVEQAVFKRDNYTCQYCGWRADQRTIVWLVLDHDIPLSRGGSHYPSNLVTACRGCNSQKAAMTGAEYRGWRQLHPQQAKVGPFV
jgi:5-methylcytosine-specific restriction endonuclease McrA